MDQQPTTVVAMMYDFDKTLTTKDMQEFTFIPNVGVSSKEFWEESNKLAKDKKMDGILAYMRCMIEAARKVKLKKSRETFVDLGKSLEYFPGVEAWFDRINSYAKGLNVTIEHYVISSGLREIIDGASIRGNFKEVFACEFLYDEDEVAVWPKNVVNYTTKTQFVYRINKGVLDLSDDENLNKYTPEDDRHVPFRNMIYIGDGLTDVPCMKLVKVSGGYSFAVYTEKSKVHELIKYGRVNFIVPADYSEGGELDARVKDVLVKISMEDKLAQISKTQQAESDEYMKEIAAQESGAQ